MGSHVPVALPEEVPVGLKFLDRQSLAAMFQLPVDLQPVPVDINRLDNQVLVRYYDDEWKKWQPGLCTRVVTPCGACLGENCWQPSWGHRGRQPDVATRRCRTCRPGGWLNHHERWGTGSGRGWAIWCRVPVTCLMRIGRRVTWWSLMGEWPGFPPLDAW